MNIHKNLQKLESFPLNRHCDCCVVFPSSVPEQRRNQYWRQKRPKQVGALDLLQRTGYRLGSLTGALKLIDQQNLYSHVA